MRYQFQASRYKISIKTGDELGAGTDANVHIVMFGDLNKTGKIPLKSSEAGGNKFEQGNTDVFYIEAPDLGKMRKITVGFDDSGKLQVSG